MPTNNKYKVLTNGNPYLVVEKVNDFITANGGILKIFGPVYDPPLSPTSFYAIIEYK